MDLSVFDPTQTVAFIFFSTVVAPILIAVLKQTGWSSQVNSLIALAVYAVVGVAAAATAGLPLTLENVVPLITIGTISGRTAYSLFWTNFGEERLNAVTSIFKAPAPVEGAES